MMNKEISTNPEKHKLPNEDDNLFEDFADISTIIKRTYENVER